MTDRISFEDLTASLESVLDIIETDVQLPKPATYRVRLSTPEACAYQ
jgi:hypothetical protein